ncbi:acriflavin resistance protein [Luminiphilus syltensis NOR5-1B]|uniref:Acriflavin resistance protein n=1 Tax=Luminiphilus syltensis NOR5-1B TaxID=565045 RepID=B8KSZ7_9GAMM|nr:efflux RND transporter permease subunit [Luminiphilus syltensis]EED35126.1 acriflavin resistance protein [Luminiphilus syltensis NOR5-1B]
MQGLIAWWVRNPVAANLLMLGILLSGVLGLINIEKEAFPAIAPDRVSINVIWPGASPQEVEQQVLQRIEESLEDISQVYRFNSTASEGSAYVEVETLPGVDINGFVNEVKGAVDSINSFPRDIENPRVRRTEWRNDMIYISISGDIGERALSRLAEDLREEVAALPYTSKVEMWGGRTEEVTIELSERAMRSYDLTFSEVADAIRDSSLNVSSGSVRTPTGDIQLRALNLADNEDDFEQIVVRQDPEGAVIRVGDIATVIDGFQQDEVYASFNGTPGIVLDVRALDNMQVMKSSETIKEWISERQKTLPDSVELSLWFDTADIYSSRMELITRSSLMGLALVFLVLILTLRPKVAIWVTAGIGIAFVGTFALLPANDVSLNVISTFAFLLVLGIVVDDAIVVGESVHHHAHSGMPGEQAAVIGTLAVSRPVIFAVLTTIVAFSPWLFLSGVEAQITRQLSIVITLALIISLIEAFCILPAHLRHVEPRHNLRGLAKRQQDFAHSIVRFAETVYQPFLRRILVHRYTTIAIFITGFVIALGLFNSGWVRFYFSPQVENESIFVNVTMPTGAPYERSLQVLRQLQSAERRLVEQVEAEAEASGEGSGEIIRGWFTSAERGTVMAIVELAPPEVRDLSARETAERFQELMGEIPDADEVRIRYTINDDTADVTLLLQHDDFDTLKSASAMLQSHFRTYDDVYFVRDDQRGAVSELHFRLLPGAEKLGMTLADVSQQVRQAYYGEEVQRLPREFGDVRVMVRYPDETRRDLHSLSDLMIRLSDGRSVPLLSVVDVAVGEGVQQIRRRNGDRIVTVRANVEPDSVQEISRSVNEDFVPQLLDRYPGLQVLKGGSQESEQEFFSEIFALYVVALFAMYALIAVAFKSYSLPLLIMTAIPYGFMGAVFGHFLFDLPMALFSYFGIGAAAGVVVNDNLVLVDYIRRREDDGLKPLDAVMDAAVNRFRPILLTTVTTFVGLIPMMAERSTNAQFLKPAVLSLAFGVFFALFVSLLMVPALYMAGWDMKRGFIGLKQRFMSTKSGAAIEPQPSVAEEAG